MKLVFSRITTVKLPYFQPSNADARTHRPSPTLCLFLSSFRVSHLPRSDASRLLSPRGVMVRQLYQSRSSPNLLALSTAIPTPTNTRMHHLPFFLFNLSLPLSSWKKKWLSQIISSPYFFLPSFQHLLLLTSINYCLGRKEIVFWVWTYVWKQKSVKENVCILKGYTLIIS